MRYFRGFVAAVSIVALQLGTIVSAAEVQAPSPTSTHLFTDDFSDKSLSSWVGGGLFVRDVIPDETVEDPTWESYAGGTMTGQPAYLYHSLSFPTTRLFMSFFFSISNRGSASINFAKLRTSSGAAIAELYVTSSGRLGLRNDILGKATTSSVPIAPDRWYRASLGVVVTGTTSTTTVMIEGLTIPELTMITDLGTNPVGRIQIGENLAGRTGEVAFDTVEVMRTAPTAPADVTASLGSSVDAALSWAASSDRDVSFFEVRRDEAVVATLVAAETSWVDTQTSADSTYGYSVRAVDRYGHRSAWSPTAFVTTPADGGVWVWQAVQDGFIDAAKPAVAFGGRTELRVDRSPDQRTYLRFEVSGIGSRAPAAPVLRVHAATALTAGFEVRTVAGGWSESTLTYDNAPPADTLLATSGPVAADTWVEIPVPGFVSGNGTYDVALVGLSNTALRLDSRERGVPAELVADVNNAGSNATPVAGNLTVVADEGVDMTWVPDVLDRDGGPLTCSIASRPTVGYVSVQQNCSGGRYELRWSPNYFGTQTFTYQVSDGVLSATGVVTVLVRSVNDPPVPSAQLSNAWDASGSTELTVMATDADDQCRLTLEITPPAHGSLTPLAPVPCASSVTFGSYRYTPADGWVGADSFKALFRDPHGLESSVVVRLDVPPPTDTFTVLASEDTWVDESKPTANYRYGLSLVVDTSPQRQIYLRFPVAGLGATRPAGLTLRLDASALPAGQFIEVRTASGAWDEATLTWSNAPGSGPVVARQAVPVSGWVDIPLPSGLLSGDGTVDLVLTSTSTTQTTISGSFYERNSLMPRLVVTK